MEADGAADSLTIEQRADGVAVLRFDVAGEPVNTLQADFATQLERALGKLKQDASVKAVVFTSGKPDSFIAGADIKLLRAVERAEQASELSRNGQRVLLRLADFHVPVVAAIHGACLGGVRRRRPRHVGLLRPYGAMMAP